MAQLCKTIGGLAIASCKTIGGLAIASCKTIGGLDNTSGGGGTDWTADATMKGLYYFETSPGLNQDSKSTNHVDDAAALEAPAANTGDKIQGSQSADFETTGNDDGLVLTMSNATADFPGNGTGDGEITVACWIKAESFGTQNHIFSIAGSKQRLSADSSGHLIADVDGAATGTLTTTATISLATWYFVGWIYSNSSDLLAIFIKPQGGGATIWETASVPTVGTIDDASASNFIIGARLDTTSGACWDGLIDAMAVFNGKAFTQGELEGVYTNGWTGAGW